MGSLPFLSFCGLTGLPLFLLQIVPELLIREEVVDVLHKQMAVQMLDLVAESSGRQALALHLEPVAIPVLGPDPDRVTMPHLPGTLRQPSSPVCSPL